MEAKELRVGNYVDLYGTIATIQRDDFAGSGIAIDKGKPIILNKHWINKLSGITNNEVTYISVSNLKAELHFEFYDEEIVTIIKSQFSDLILDRLKYVHQLQNLYFALTNDELKYQKNGND